MGYIINFFFFVVVTYYLIKWAIELICIIIVGIAKLVTWISNKRKNNKKNKKNKKNITKTFFADTKLKVKESLKTLIEVKKEKLNIFDKSIYDSLFPVQIRNRGEEYYYEDKIKCFREDGNNYSCIVKGNEYYKVNLSIDENNNIISSSCTCPYFSDNGHNCKHIYALLYKIKCSGNKDKIITEINNQISGIKTIVKNATDYTNKNKSHFSYSAIDEFNNYLQQYISQINYYEKNCSEKVLEDTLLKHLDNLLNISLELNQKIKKTLNEGNSVTDVNTSISKQQNENKIEFTDMMKGFASLNKVDKHLNKKEDVYNKKLEDEMNDYYLEDWQKDLVREGKYEPWNFEEDNLEEEDYYYDDSK